MRFTTLALLGASAVSFAPTAGAQTTYSRAASQADLADQGRFPNVQPTCIERIGTRYFFFDATSQQILSYRESAAAGSRTEVVVSAADIDATAGTDVTQCRDMDGDFVRLVFGLSNAANEDLVLSTGPGGGPRLLASGPSADGITGITEVPGQNDFYVSQSQFFGAPEDGVYAINPFDATANLALRPILINSDLDLVGIATSDNGDIYATSSENGVGQYKNKIVRIVSPRTAPTLQILVDPFAGPNPIFVNGDDGGLEDIFVGQQGGTERIFVMNNSFGAPQGETIGRFNLDGSNPVVAFTEAGLIAAPEAMATPTTAFSTAGGNGYMSSAQGLTGDTSQIFLASRGTNNGQVALFLADVRNLPTPAEETAASAAGYAIEMANPVRGAVSVRLVQPEAASVRASVVDVLGREVAVLAEGSRAASSVATFDASGLAPGVYHVVLRSGGFATMRSITVVR